MAEKMNLYQKLQKVQFEMKAPKNLFNKFGNYNYRNCEGILEAFKPYGEKYGLAIILEDSVFKEGDRYYLMATATMIDVDAPDQRISNSALARESEVKKGMDDSQITGTASSYARKCALNGLLLLDDTKDADSDEYHKQTNRRRTAKEDSTDESETEPVDAKTADINTIKSELKRTGVNEPQILRAFNVNSLEEMTTAQILACITKLEGIETKEK